MDFAVNLQIKKVTFILVNLNKQVKYMKKEIIHLERFNYHSITENSEWKSLLCLVNLALTEWYLLVWNMCVSSIYKNILILWSNRLVS